MADETTPATLRAEAVRLRDVAEVNAEHGWENNAESCRAGADALDRLAREAEARERDAAHPEFVPEAVMDAAFESQASWWRPGQSTAIQTVVVPQLIENVATATYAATRAIDA